MSQTYRSDEGGEIDIDPSTVVHLNALKEVTNRDTADLLVEAVKMYREFLIPSTKPKPPRATSGRGRRGNQAAAQS